MTCRAAESLLFAERDGALSESQRAGLVRHMVACAACRQLHADLSAAAENWRANTAQVAVPDAEAEWRRLRGRIGGAEVRTSPPRRVAPVVWLVTPLAAAAAIALAFLLQSGPAPRAEDTARAEFVEAGAADATTMVYTDRESGWLVVWAVDASGKTRG